MNGSLFSTLATKSYGHKRDIWQDIGRSIPTLEYEMNSRMEANELPRITAWSTVRVFLLVACTRLRVDSVQTYPMR
jgi:hypothetical protein